MLKNVLTHSELISTIVLLTSTSAIAVPLDNWRFDPDQSQLEVTVPAGVKPEYSFLANPARIVLDLPETEVGTATPQQDFKGAIRQVRVFQFQPNRARIVLELAPNQSLSNPQVQLQQIQDADATRDRWTLRPILVARPLSPQTQAVFSPLRPIQTTIAQPITQPILPQPTPIAQSSPVNDFGLPPAPPTPTPNVTVPPIQSKPMPPAAGSGNAPAGSSLLFPDAPTTPQAPASGLKLPEINPSLAIPDSFPPINAPANSQPTVTVPPIERRSPVAEPPVIEQRSTSTPAEDTPVPVRARTIQFGQPLPTLINQHPQSVPAQISAAPFTPNSVLPSGTKLSLFYPGNEPLKLQGRESRQDVLILQNEIRDRAGRVLVAPGSAVLGKFETDRTGSRFITQAVTIQGQNLAFIGQSDAIYGTRQMRDDRLLQNSGIGAIAGAVLGGLSGSGLIGGAALGAGVTYLTAPRPATIHPGQLIQIQLTQDFTPHSPLPTP